MGFPFTGCPTLRIQLSDPIPIPNRIGSRTESLQCPAPIELASSAGSTPYSVCQVLRSKSRSVDSTQQPTSNQLQFPTTLDDLISLNPFKEKEVVVQVQESMPSGPREHTVNESDTITSIAASYDVTPSELIRVNRLASRIIFPGQVLKVPPRGPIPDRAEVSLPKTPPVYQRKFIKIHVKHITDGNGVVSGTLLVTPNAVMFDPNVSDPLVLDQGAEAYGVILPLEVIVAAGIYSDIAHMKVEGKEFTSDIKPVLYPESLDEEEPDPPHAAPATLVEPGAVLENQSNDSGFDTGPRQSPTPAPSTGGIPPPPSSGQQPHSGNESRKTKVLKRLSFPLAWMDSLSGTQATKEETQSAPPETKINYRSLVSLDDMPDLFASFDKLLPFAGSHSHQHSHSTQHHHYPLTSTASSDYYDSPPWYLCLTTGYPKGKKLKPGLVVSYGQKKSIKPEYWFGVPKSQVEDLYKFWMLWWPHLYGDVDEKVITARGYNLVDYESEIFREEDMPLESLKGELNELTKESWEMIKAPYSKLYSFIRSQTLLSGSEDSAEVVSMSEELRKALYGSDEYIPELLEESEILDVEDVKLLARDLSARAEGYPWFLVFSTSRDGFSLNTLYRKMDSLEESPILIVIEDTRGRVFGSLVSTPLRVSDHFYGTGQSFLFRLKPEFQLFKWTGENMYFIKGNTESLSIGAGDGNFGLWFDGDLNVGRSERCGTYGNPPLVSEKDFVVKTIECWAFGVGSSFEGKAN